jgi:hypothetical protein
MYTPQYTLPPRERQTEIHPGEAVEVPKKIVVCVESASLDSVSIVR